MTLRIARAQIDIPVRDIAGTAAWLQSRSENDDRREPRADFEAAG